MVYAKCAHRRLCDHRAARCVEADGVRSENGHVPEHVTAAVVRNNWTGPGRSVPQGNGHAALAALERSLQNDVRAALCVDVVGAMHGAHAARLAARGIQSGARAAWSVTVASGRIAALAAKRRSMGIVRRVHPRRTTRCPTNNTSQEKVTVSNLTLLYIICPKIVFCLN
ncbi:hypothetical protein O0L34_g7655 [Tuta absoluta]|nr:hypothetical protein O0L34_g10161 [Tuta absoluta]KAJ2948415.1 hypothetical protein O0L34_g7655 [Tuta absoluta]